MINSNESPQVRLLLGVWGEKFIKDFLTLSLASLLAPGNIPALAKQYKTTFVFLTRTNDIPVFESEPAYQVLRNICQIEFIPINDLVVIGNYSSTLTLAYDRAIKQMGEAMLNTYFIFLTSDYIMADGSFAGLMRYIAEGYSGIQAGNFQVTQEDIEPYLLENIDRSTHVMRIAPRELLKKSLQHLHPIATTSLIDQHIIHNHRANRFFYRPSNDILAGRFYLLHMLCIKPETTDYQISASCDYSFIPEMCPSGNIATITDSDHYLVVEIQPKEHELNHINWGSYDKNKLAYALSEWTTWQHRKNSRQTIIYHCTDLSNSEKNALENALDAFITPINNQLQHFRAKNHRNHPYWLINKSLINKSNSTQVVIDTSEQYDLTPLNYISPQKKWFHFFYGAPPQVHRWYYRWYEYHSVMQKIQQIITPTSRTSTLALYDSYSIDFMQYAKWLKNALHITQHYHIQCLNYASALVTSWQAKPFQTCILLVKMSELSNIQQRLSAIKKILTPSGTVVLHLINEKYFLPSSHYDFKKDFSSKIGNLLNSQFRITDVTTINDTASLLGSMVINKINHKYTHNRKKRFLFYCLAGIPGSIIYFIINCFVKTMTKKSGHCTNILVTLTPIEANTGKA